MTNQICDVFSLREYKTTLVVSWWNQNYFDQKGGWFSRLKENVVYFALMWNVCNCCQRKERFRDWNKLEIVIGFPALNFWQTSESFLFFEKGLTEQDYLVQCNSWELKSIWKNVIDWFTWAVNNESFILLCKSTSPLPLVLQMIEMHRSELAKVEKTLLLHFLFIFIVIMDMSMATLHM